jgi:coenzyme F420-reducing hydrogenase alpha subunit
MKASREITLSPTTRIEGHGKVTIFLNDDGNVSDAHFHATETRGFEYFMRGMEAEEVPFIVSRICGVCSTAHVVASVKAIENIYGTEITETARKLRELLLMGQIISNHALVFFFLTLPDFWFPAEEDPSKRNILQIMRMNPEVGRKAIRLRTFGVNLLKVIGRREVHIVSVIPGGVIASLSQNERNALLEQAEEACEITREAVQMGKQLFERNWKEFKSVGAFETCHMGLVNKELAEFYEGNVRLLNREGTVEAELNEQNYMENIEEKRLPWTYAKFAYYKKFRWPEGIIQVGPTSRMNVSSGFSTPMANKELREFKRRFGSPAHATLLFDYARLIDLLYACERAKELLEDPDIMKTDTRIPVKSKAGEGVGIVEAPRGTLAHRYVLTAAGKLREIKMVIPTQINNAAINMSVKDAASKYISDGEVKPGLLNGVEMLVRAYDPCIKCAARSVNERIAVDIRDRKGKLIRALR